ncbi:MAG: HAD family hydrolase [Crenarchaeota archaeon]|nr:HAD family hydrolase [Thermoproteota archaeon]
MRLKVRAVLFDLDGTLVETFEAFHIMVNDILRRFNMPERSFSENARLVGKTSRTIAETIAKETGLNMSSEELSTIMVGEWIYTYMPRYGKLYPDALETLRELKKRGYLLGVVSNTSRDELPNYLNIFRIRGFFDVTVSAGDSEKPKPAPDPVIKAVETLGVKPEEAVMIGDRPEDVEAGKAAGVYTIAVLRSIRPRAELETAQPDFIITSLSEILTLLK